MVETIIYIAIASIFFTISIGFFMQVRSADVRAGIRREIKENASQAIESFKYFIRNAEAVDAGGSEFGKNPGSLFLTYPDGGVLFDTYTKNISVGGAQTEIRKLRYTKNGNSHDISSDHVNVADYAVLDMTAADEPDAVQIKISFLSVNPAAGPDYDSSLDLSVTVNIRHEI